MKKTFRGKNLTARSFNTNDELISALTGLSLKEIEKRRKKMKEKVKKRLKEKNKK